MDQKTKDGGAKVTETFEQFRRRVEAEEDKEMDALSARAAAFFRARRKTKEDGKQEPPACP